MTELELMNTYDSMSMPEERVSDIEARLMKLYENSASIAAPELPADSPKEYRIDGKKHSVVRTAAVSLSAAAAAVLLVLGGRFLINGLPVFSDPPIDAETDEIRFESADDIPAYGSAGCFDVYEHSLIAGAGNYRADSLFTQQIRSGEPVSVVKIKITSGVSHDEDGFTEYEAVITECLSGKNIAASSDKVSFRLRSTYSEQVIGEPSLAVGDELIAAAAENNGVISLVRPDKLLFECFTVNGHEFAAQRHWFWADLAAIADDHQYGDISRITTVTDVPVSYYGIYEQSELASALEKLVLVSDEDPTLSTEPLPDLYGSFTLDFGLVEPFCYFWFDENHKLIRNDAREDIFGNVHGCDDEDVPDIYCAGFFEDDLGWYMRASNRNGGDSMYWVPNDDPEYMYRYDFGSDALPARADYSECYLRQGIGDWSFSDPNNDGSFYTSADQTGVRQPVENYVGKISWLGKEKLCADHGENWAAEFNKWYNCGESIEMDGTGYTRRLLKGAGGAEAPYYYGMGDVWLIDHTDTRIVAAFRFTADDENAATAAQYFILTAEYQNGSWQESWQKRTDIDAMMMQGVISPADPESCRKEQFSWGTDKTIAMISSGSDLFTHDDATDEYYRVKSLEYSQYLQIDDYLFVIGREQDALGMFLSGYRIGSGDLALQSPFIAGDEVEQFFLSPDQLYIVIVTADDSGQKRLYVCERTNAEFFATATNSSGETQFTLDDGGFTITKDGVERRYDYDMGCFDGGPGGQSGKKPDGGSNCILVTLPYMKSAETYPKNELYCYDQEEKRYRRVLDGTFIAGTEDGDTVYVLMNTVNGCSVYSIGNGECRTIVDSAFFEQHGFPSDNITMEVRSGDNIALMFDDSRSTVWLFDKYTGQFITDETPADEDTLLNDSAPAEGEAYYDDVFQRIGLSGAGSGYSSYADLLSSVKEAEAHYGSEAQFSLCRTVRVLPGKEAKKYVGSSGDRTVYEVQVIENLITGEKMDKTVLLVITMGSPEIQTKGDPVYAPGEMFTCAMLEDPEKNCMQAIYGFRYDVRTYDNNRIAYSRNNQELDGLALTGSQNISVSVVTSTSMNPAAYSQRIPLSSVAEFLAEEWSGHGIG